MRKTRLLAYASSASAPMVPGPGQKLVQESPLLADGRSFLQWPKATEMVQAEGSTLQGGESYSTEFRKLSEILQEKMNLYNAAKDQARSAPSNVSYQIDLSIAVEELQEALLAAGKAHPNRKIGEKWIKDAQNFTSAPEEEQENALKEIGLGVAKIIVAPLALAGLAIYSAGQIVVGVGAATGHILSGVGSILKGIGKAGKKALTNS